MRNRINTIVVVGVIGGCVLAASPLRSADDASAAAARRILAAAGTRGGLVVHLGCGDGKLTAALRANDRYVVHGLDEDVRNVARAREHVQSL
ncbi:MAG: class I SAM-dependent methyltransferase, partial [Armatimonadota bacterium]